MYRMLFLALKKVQTIKITPRHIATSQKGGDVKMEVATYYIIFQSHLPCMWEK